MAQRRPGHGPAGKAGPWAIELFTSQGCSSCPPADAELGKLARRPDIVALSFHVDYWDYIGWKDRFATQGDHRAAAHLRPHAEASATSTRPRWWSTAA